MPKVSVIVPNYNHARYLRQRIDSILAQTFHDFELILLDDCSTDESRSVLSQYVDDPRVRVQFNEVNSGSTFKQWNKGVRLARGKYIWMAESDDYADERFLEKLVPLLDADASVMFAYCRSWRLGEDGLTSGFADSYVHPFRFHRWESDFSIDGREECRSRFIFANQAPNASAVIFQKSAYERAGGADEGFRLAGDWKLWAAIALTGRIVYLAEPLNFFRFHTATVRDETARGGVYVLETLRTVRWLLSQVTPTQSNFEMMRKAHARDWVPVVMSLHVPKGVKRAILREVSAIDPYPFLRVLRPALSTIVLKITRHLGALHPRAASGSQ